MKVLIDFEVTDETPETTVAGLLRHIADMIEDDYIGGIVPPCGTTETIKGTWGITDC